MLNVYPDSFQLNFVTPLDSERTRPVPTSRATRVTSSRSRTYERGRYSVRRENGVHHFHGLLHRFVVTPPTPRG
jgi:choline monooxygenase